MSLLNKFYYNPMRHSITSPKKKKRKYSADVNAKHQHQQQHHQQVQQQNLNTVIIDRAVDFTKYNKSTSLYTLCRDWLHAKTAADSAANKYMYHKSQPQQSNQPAKRLSDDFLNQMNVNDVNNLPLPSRNLLRITREKKKYPKRLMAKTTDGGEMSQDDLLKSNLIHWKQVKKDWMDYYKNDNLLYKDTSDTLKCIYEDM